MRATAVIGANYGDEGKGAVVDRLCAAGTVDVVVRANGGAQAGHTVVDPIQRHVFHHVGAGTFGGAATFLAREFVCNPILFNAETRKLVAPPKVVVDPRCRITTPWDMAINQAIERKRDWGRHGSCGIGFGETIERSERGYAFTILDAINSRSGRVLDRIVSEWVPARLDELGIRLESTDTWGAAFFADLARFLEQVTIAEASWLRDQEVVFEGAQGLCLDWRSLDFPFVTRSATGLVNVLAVCSEAGIDEVDAIYVARPYLTRHGAGPLPNEIPTLPFPGIVDRTNVEHPWQGRLRYAPIDLPALGERISADPQMPGRMAISKSIALTCVDQVGPWFNALVDGRPASWPIGEIEKAFETEAGFPVRYTGNGPSRRDGRYNMEVTA